MRLSTAAASVQVLVTGLISGIFIAIATTEPARLSIEPSAFVQLQQGIHVVYLRMMPPLVIAAILAGIVWLISLRSQVRSAAFFLAAIATVCSIGAFILTVAVNFPLNDLLMTWNAASPPANVKALWLPWESAHIVRTVIYMIAFVCAITGSVLMRSNSQTEYLKK
ncbi:MAG: DUF1772 domain-containing protein [Chloracidobacterium sp.]|nr:DUF1772 domain-containing protein [Chloracidobacterium sp.]